MPAGMPSIAATTLVEISDQHDVLLEQQRELGRGASARNAGARSSGAAGIRRPAAACRETPGRADRREAATLRRRVADDQLAGVEHADARRQRERLGHVVRDEDHGRAELPLNPQRTRAAARRA